jgi:hypothetical protein
MDELMYTIPFLITKKKKFRITYFIKFEECQRRFYLETVAGEALSILCGSNTTLQRGAIGIRSPLAKVNVLLSSSTLLRFSIQIASTGPSSTIQI